MTEYPCIVEATTKSGLRLQLADLGPNESGRYRKATQTFFGRELTDITPLEQAWDDLPEVTHCEHLGLGLGWRVESNGLTAFRDSSVARQCALESLTQARRFMAFARAIEEAEAETNIEELINDANEALAQAHYANDLSPSDIENIIAAYHKAGARFIMEEKKETLPIPGWLGGKA